MSSTYRIYDSLHGFIRFNSIERDLIDSIAFQRLHHLHQLGIAYLVYPGATHSRFEHSLGVMELATRIYEQVLLELPKDLKVDKEYYRKVIRLGALCHDMGHLPFSHVAESVLLGSDGHERWTLEIIKSKALEHVFLTLQQEYPKYHVVEDVIKMSIGEKKLKSIGYNLIQPFTDVEKVFSEIVTGDFFGSDRIDYLLRDARCTGVSHGLFDYHQLIETLTIVQDPQSGQIRFAIEENGIQACEALLLARHFMHKRVYKYPSVKAYTFHLARFMKCQYEGDGRLSDLSYYLSLTDSSVICRMQDSFRDPSSKGYKDAAAIIERRNRFVALSINKKIEESTQKELIEKYQIPQEQISFHFEEPKSSRKISFLVKKKNGKVQAAKECMEITIPSHPVTWVYVPGEYKEPLSLELERL